MSPPLTVFSLEKKLFFHRETINLYYLLLIFMSSVCSNAFRTQITFSQYVVSSDLLHWEKGKQHNHSYSKKMFKINPFYLTVNFQQSEKIESIEN